MNINSVLTTKSKHEIRTQLGIWMDHSHAYVMEYCNTSIETMHITSDFTRDVQSDTLHKSEGVMLHKEQQQQTDFYRMLGQIIKKYQKVVLFGAINATAELFYILKADPDTSGITIEIKPADRMTQNQRNAFVRNYFERSDEF